MAIKDIYKSLKENSPTIKKITYTGLAGIALLTSVASCTNYCPRRYYRPSWSEMSKYKHTTDNRYVGGPDGNSNSDSEGVSGGTVGDSGGTPK